MSTSYIQETPTAFSDVRTENASPLASPLSPNGNAIPRPTALSNKLSSVLSASYADLDIREALDILDRRKVKNTPDARRNLRLDAQKEVIDCNAEIVSDFGRVAEQLKRIGETITSLNNCCDAMRRHISAAREETSPVVEEASSLISGREEVAVKQQLLDAFTSHFTTNPDDLLTLTSLAEPVDDQFFMVLSRVKRMHKDCQLLLGTENQTLGLEVMEQSSRNLNSAFQKLYRWIQREFKSLDLESPQINSSIRRALRVLAERPTLFQSCLDFFAEAREHTLSDSFHVALTGSSPDSERPMSTKPIEMFAHDPLRYVGDMLAWAHSATVSEREALEALFISEGEEIAKSIQAGLESEFWSRAEDEDIKPFDGRKALNELVNRDINSVGRTLKQRIEQVIQSHEDPTMAYQISNLVNFYRVTFDKLLGGGSGFSVMLMSLEESALRQFRATIGDHIAAVQSDLPQVPQDLSIPSFLSEALEQLKALMKSFDTSLAPMSGRGAEFEPIMREALDPFLAGCDTLAKELTEPRSSMFVLNCCFAARDVLVPFPFTEKRAAGIYEAVQKHTAKLIEYQHAYFLHTSGLHSLVAALASISDSVADLRSIPSLGPFGPDSLPDIAQTLDDFLPSALLDASENLKRLKSSKMAYELTEEAASRFCEDFEFIERKIMAADEVTTKDGIEQEGEETIDLRSMFPRTSGEIRVLLS
ncbi:MAG: Golgi transport complex subunit 6 [Piccolia ochrophora]|nr:MAG: Golgi transport complex subunit 6 [Piccolia ochrophora]